jgi:hypothetical protein
MARLVREELLADPTCVSPRVAKQLVNALGIARRMATDAPRA